MIVDRRAFLASSLATAQNAPASSLHRHIRARPLAIAMWDFSWLERRWPGAGYEDWDEALSQLKQRGYDAVRIDAYPHLIEAGPTRTWELLPHWWFQDWGASSRCRVQVQPNLNEFLRRAARHGLCAGLSSWFRLDTDNTRARLSSPGALGRAWKAALDSIAADGLLPHILYVDLCNEFPLDVWAPFAPKGLSRATPEGARWMRDSIAVVRAAYPQLDYTFSFTSEYETFRQQDVSMLDLLELHLWMTHFSDFYRRVGYGYQRYDQKGYDHLALYAEKLYRSDPARWQERLAYGIGLLAEWSRLARKPLLTTECWALVDYKDAPMLPWDYILELCEFGVRRAAATGCWAAMATSNFCGPQFRGMWREVEWHQRMTSVIHSAPLPAWFRS